MCMASSCRKTTKYKMRLFLGAEAVRLRMCVTGLYNVKIDRCSEL
jgi:hypothetical protein